MNTAVYLTWWSLKTVIILQLLHFSNPPNVMLLMSSFTSFSLCIAWLIRYWWFYCFLNLHISFIIVDPLPLLCVCFYQGCSLPHNFLVSAVCCAAFTRSVMSHSLWPLWAVVRQALLSLEFPRQEYWSGLPFPTPRDLPNPDQTHISCVSALSGSFFTSALPRKPFLFLTCALFFSI